MVNSWPRNTKKETEEKTTERTIRTCTAWSHSGKRQFRCHLVIQSCVLWKFLFIYLFITSFFGGRTQPCSWEVVKPAVVPQVWVLQTAPLPPGLERKMRHTAWYSWHAYPDEHQVSNLISTFSMVATNNIARVIRCSRITNISRYAIFYSLKKKQKNKKPKTFLRKRWILMFVFCLKTQTQSQNTLFVLWFKQTHFFFATSLAWNVLITTQQPCRKGKYWPSWPLGPSK